MIELTVRPNDAGRLDKFLLAQLPQLTPGLLHKYMRENKIKVDGKKLPLSARLCAGSRVRVYLPEAAQPQGRRAGLPARKGAVLPRLRGRRRADRREAGGPSFRWTRAAIRPTPLKTARGATCMKRAPGSRTAALRRGCATGWTQAPPAFCLLRKARRPSGRSAR